MASLCAVRASTSSYDRERCVRCRGGEGVRCVRCRGGHCSGVRGECSASTSSCVREEKLNLFIRSKRVFSSTRRPSSPPCALSARPPASANGEGGSGVGGKRRASTRSCVRATGVGKGGYRAGVGGKRRAFTSSCVRKGKVRSIRCNYYGSKRVFSSMRRPAWPPCAPSARPPAPEKEKRVGGAVQV